MEQVSKKSLRAFAESIEAKEILGRKSNIYQYEKARYERCKELGATYTGMAYSAGIYGNTGRIDKLVSPDGKTIEYIFYTE